MSVFPEAPSDIRPGPFGEAPPTNAGTFVLAGVDIVAAVWVLVTIPIGLARAAINTHDTAADDAQFWSGWIGHFRSLIETSLMICILVIPVLLIMSGRLLFTDRVRSQPQVFRIHLGGTIALTLAAAAWFILSSHGLIYYGEYD